MSYVQRDRHNRIIGVYSNPQPGIAEEHVDGDVLVTEILSDEMLDRYIEEKTVSKITFKGATVLNDDTTRIRLLQKINSLTLQRSNSAAIKWQTLNGFMDLDLVHLQGLYLACDQWQQKCFNAAQAVTLAHQKAPFLTWDDAKSFFDAELEK